MKSAISKTFIFDFDSTIFPGESLDEIIKHSLQSDPNCLKKSKVITEICNQGMAGSLSMEDSLKQRLDIAAPTASTIASYIKLNKNRIDKRFQQLLINLQLAGHNVWVVSGGFEEWIKPLLTGIIPLEHIHANQIIDPNKPMLFNNIRRRDKEEIIEQLIQKYQPDPSGVNIIGDGATDFSVFDAGLATTFVGAFFYAGATNRTTVLKKATENKQPYFLELPNFLTYANQFVV